MDDKMGKEIFINWKIENFSCWNNVVHAKCIKSPSSYATYCEHMELYPRGFSGLDEHLVVRFCDIENGFSGGELSFIGSDGSNICTIKVNASTIIVDSCFGPKYEVVIALIKKQEAEYVDQLTLKFVPSEGKLYEQCMCTNIDVLKKFLKIDKYFIANLKPDASDDLFCSCSAFQNGEGIFLKIARKNERIQLILDPLMRKCKKPVLVEGCMRLLSNNGTLVRHEKNKHVFEREEPWTFSESLEFNEVMDISNTLIVCVKIVEGELKEIYNHINNPRAVTMVQEGYQYLNFRKNKF